MRSSWLFLSVAKGALFQYTQSKGLRRSSIFKAYIQGDNFMKIITEPYSRQDFDAVLALFYETVHQVNCADYSQAQLDAWAPKEADAGRHKGELTAFAVWDGGAYFDCLFVRPAYLRRGIATSLADSAAR